MRGNAFIEHVFGYGCKSVGLLGAGRVQGADSKAISSDGGPRRAAVCASRLGIAAAFRNAGEQTGKAVIVEEHGASRRHDRTRRRPLLLYAASGCCAVRRSAPRRRSSALAASWSTCSRRRLLSPCRRTATRRSGTKARAERHAGSFRSDAPIRGACAQARATIVAMIASIAATSATQAGQPAIIQATPPSAAPKLPPR